ncbi:hypothetical protein [Lentzea californiensis]|uniref:hypothetical protein n=1 Tax=Lentzea californiensis TaxID=438851 RepID=UPI0021667D75|nr:hypothetical protein [Lentzea californiensis]MCR3751162.1 hypothetical protein [Lentzea californiensis]
MNFRGMLRRIAGAGLALAAVGAVLMSPVTATAAPADAGPASITADPSEPWDLVYGATKAFGTVRWHARSVDVDFTLKASYCRRLYVTPYDANYKEYPSRSTSLHCDTTKTGTLNLVVDIPGGPAHVIACLQDGADDWLTCEQYDRP